MRDDAIRLENEIIERSKRDPRAFGELYERYFDRIYYFALRRTGDEDTAGDLASQTFVNALNHLPRYENRGVPFSAWLYRIATNEINKYYRKKKGKKIFSIEESRIRELVEQNNPGPEGWDEELVQRLLSYLKDLPTDMLQVLELRFFEDKDFREIAFILEMTESGAKMRAYRALDLLRRNFNIKMRYKNE
jgi:RNA polymerase sigma-70 factor, ECF subfamily